MSPTRTFVAFSPSETIKKEVDLVQQKFRESRADVYWEPRDKLHATLRFIGALESATLPEVIRVLRGVIERYPPFTITFESVGAFPTIRKPKVIWIGCTVKSPALSRMKSAVDSALHPLGFPIEERVYAPHVTIGRVKSERGLKYLLSMLETITFEPRTESIGSISILRSRLTSLGSEYSVLETIQLHSL